MNEIPTTSRQLNDLLAEFQSVVLDGLRHGFAEFTVEIKTVKGGKRQVVLKAGKSHKFTVPRAEIPN